MDCAAFFKELEEHFNKSKIKFKWNWEESQNKFKSNDWCFLCEYESEYPVFNNNCEVVTGNSKYLNRFYARNENELVSYIAFELLCRTKELPIELHARMLLNTEINHWTRNYFKLLSR